MSPRPSLCNRWRTLDPHDLDPDRSLPRPVELRHQQALPLPEQNLSSCDLEREAVPEQHRAQMRVRIHAIAVGLIRIVVHPVEIARDDMLEEALDVGMQGALRFVDEKRARGVHRPQARYALVDT